MLTGTNSQIFFKKKRFKNNKKIILIKVAITFTCGFSRKPSHVGPSLWHHPLMIKLLTSVCKKAFVQDFVVSPNQN